MTVAELKNEFGLTPFHLPNPGQTVAGGYVGDLLSWVMGRAEPDQIWITIMSNRNVAAVAQLTEVACVILAEGVRPDDDLLTAAQAQAINLLGSECDSFALAAKLSEVISNKE